MVTKKEVSQIIAKLSLQTQYCIDRIEEISCIIYVSDVIDCGDIKLIDRHIDIEMTFGETLELHKETPLFEYICTLCRLPVPGEKQEIVTIYQKESDL